MEKVNYNEVYLGKNTILQKEIVEYILKIYQQEKENIFSVFEKVKSKIEKEYWEQRIQTKNKIIDIEKRELIYKLEKPIYVVANEKNFEIPEKELEKYGILNFDLQMIPDENEILSLLQKSFYFMRAGLFDKRGIKVGDKYYSNIVLMKNDKLKNYNINSKMWIEKDNIDNILVFPIQKIFKNKKNIIQMNELISYLIEKEDDKFYLYDEKLDISQNIGNLFFYGAVAIENDDEVKFFPDVLEKLIRTGKFVFSNEFIENKILEEENRKSKIEYVKSNLNDTSLGLWSIYDRRKTKEEKLKKYYTEKSLYGKNPFEDVDENSTVFVEIGNYETKILIKDSNGNIYPKSIMGNDKIFNIVKFNNIKKFIENYNECESRPSTSKDDVVFSIDVYNEYLKSKENENKKIYWIDLEKIYNNDIQIEGTEINLIEIFAYTIGIYLNNEINKKIFLRFNLSFTNARTKEELGYIKENFEKGIRKSIPSSILKDKIMDNFKIEYRIEHNTAILSGLLKTVLNDPEKSSKEKSYIVVSMNEKEFCYSMGIYKKVMDSSRYDFEIQKNISNGICGFGIYDFALENIKKIKIGSKIEKSLDNQIADKKINDYIEKITKKLVFDIENNEQNFTEEIKVVLDVNKIFIEKIKLKLEKKIKLMKKRVEFVLIDENITIPLKNNIKLNKDFLGLYGLCLCQRSGRIKLYKEEIIDEEEFLYQIGRLTNGKFEVLLDKNNKSWVEISDTLEKETEIQYMDTKGEINNLLIITDRSYEDGKLFIKIRERDTIDYTVFDSRNKQVEDIKTKRLNYKIIKEARDVF